MSTILKETVQLSPENCFSVFSRIKAGFDFPLHYHREFELNFVRSASGAKRIVGDSIEVIDDIDLVLIGPNLAHSWYNHKCKSEKIEEITVQWHQNLFEGQFIQSKHLYLLRKMLNLSSNGIVFSSKASSGVYPLLQALEESSGFPSLILLTSILNELATSTNYRILSDTAYSHIIRNKYQSRRLAKVFDYLNAHFSEPLTLKEVADLVSMSEASFSRFIKQRTGNTFIDSLNDIRISNTCRLLIETNISVSDISYQCGFNNYSHFHRIFKKKKKCTPKEFRENFRYNCTSNCQDNPHFICI